MMIDTAEKPNSIPWPPIILVASIAAGWLLMYLLPIPIIQAPSNAMRMGGTLIIALAIALDIWTMLTFKKQKTTVLPHKAASNLATSGPFAISRNPIYLANVMIVFGLALRWNNMWLILMAAVCGYLILNLAIKREEAHLAAKFPEEWAHYSGIVRRWI